MFGTTARATTARKTIADLRATATAAKQTATAEMNDVSVTGKRGRTTEVNNDTKKVKKLYYSTKYDDKVYTKNIDNDDDIDQDLKNTFTYIARRNPLPEIKLNEKNQLIVTDANITAYVINYLIPEEENVSANVEQGLKWVEIPDTGIKKYGPMGSWDVSRVTNMSHLFSAIKHSSRGRDLASVVEYEFTGQGDQNINDWDVSNVTDMSYMFYYSANFNGPLNNWDVSKVKNMESMFYAARRFNQPLNNWNVSNVENMEEMFCNAKKFNQDLNSWDVSKVEDMDDMFLNADNFNPANFKQLNISQKKREGFWGGKRKTKKSSKNRKSKTKRRRRHSRK